MATTAEKTCFISAPFGLNTSALIDALTERGVKATRLDNLKPGDSLIGSVRREIRMADFVCVVLTAGEVGGFASLEAGLALGARRPLMILAEPDAEIPFEFQQFLYVRVMLNDAQAIGRVLDAYAPVPDQTARVGRRPKAGALKRLDRKVADRLLGTLKSSTTEAERRGNLVSAVVGALKSAGVRTSTVLPKEVGSTRSHFPEGADLAIWVDELQSVFGNPILIKLLSGDVNQKSVDDAFHFLSLKLHFLHLNLGVIVYYDEQNRAHKIRNPSLPLVACMPIEELIDALRQGRFTQALLDIRNRAVHGVAV